MSDAQDADALADAVQKLRIAYELYFAGVERYEPLKERTRIKKEVRRLLGVRSNNTAYKFKMQSTQATLVTYENHWDRIVRQIEEGTFKRDKLKAQRHLQAMKDVSDDVELIEDAEPVNDISDEFESLDAGDALKSLEADDGDAVRELLEKGLLKKTPAPQTAAPQTAARRPVAPAAPRPVATAAPATPTVRPATPAPVARPAPSAAKPAAPAGDDGIRQLHSAFSAARAQTGETKAISVEALAETIRKQTAAVKAQLGCERVEFKVAIKDGKAVLKAIPK